MFTTLSVAPHAGARIETPLTHPSTSGSDVAPHAGARIETSTNAT